MGMEIDIESSFWKRYFHNEDDARKIDIFNLINASIAVAAVKKPKEFVSKRLQILESILTVQAKKGLRPIVKNSSKNNQERVISHDCEDHVCKDGEGEISVGDRDEEFAGFLERELDDCEDHVCKDDGGEISVGDRDEEFAGFLERELDDCEDHVCKDDGGEISVGDRDEEFAGFLERELDDCEDHVCKDDGGEISVGDRDEEFADFLERELDDCEDHVCKDDDGEISVGDRDEEFAGFLERELDDCEDHVCKDDGGDISVGDRDEEFADFLERELDDEYAELIEFGNVMTASLKPVNVRPQLQVSKVNECDLQYDEPVKVRPQFPVYPVFKHDIACGEGELRFGKVMIAPLKPINVRPKLEEKQPKFLRQQVSEGYTGKKYEVGQGKAREIEVLKRCGGTKFDVNKKRKIEEINGNRAIDSHDLKFEATKRRYEERIQQIEKGKKRVQILDSKEIALQQRLGRNGKPKQGFGSRMKKIQKSRV